jgi:trehalose 6-phosphate phosphatase
MDIAQAIDALISTHPLAVVTDFDGTISHIAPTPAGAAADPDCRRWLGQLSRMLPLVAIISGRRAEDVRGLVGLDSIVYVGNHGVERWEKGAIHIEPIVSGQAERTKRIAEAARRVLTSRGLIFEDKGNTAAVHYRQAPDPEAAREEVASVLRKLAAGTGVKVKEGRRVIELRPEAAIDKGNALFDLLSQYDLATVVYAGDDDTDADAFAGLRRWSATGHRRAVAVAIDSPEIPQRLREDADLILEGVEGWARFLEKLVRGLAEGTSVGRQGGSTGQ